MDPLLVRVLLSIVVLIVGMLLICVASAAIISGRCSRDEEMRSGADTAVQS